MCFFLLFELFALFNFFAVVAERNYLKEQKDKKHFLKVNVLI